MDKRGGGCIIVNQAKTKSNGRKQSTMQEFLRHPLYLLAFGRQEVEPLEENLVVTSTVCCSKLRWFFLETKPKKNTLQSASFPGDFCLS